MRKKLEEQIRELGLENDFILMGTVENPFPYYAQCDLYVHAAYLEGKCIAIEEAQILGCAMLVSDHTGISSPSTYHRKGFPASFRIFIALISIS